MTFYNPLNENCRGLTIVPQVDWASAATAAAISSAATANRSHVADVPKAKMNKQGWYNRTKANAAAGKEPPRTYYCEICKVSCMGALVSSTLMIDVYIVIGVILASSSCRLNLKDLNKTFKSILTLSNTELKFSSDLQRALQWTKAQEEGEGEGGW